MGGLARICKALGGMTVIGASGNKVEWAWDYAADAPVDSVEMPFGSDRWKVSEQAKYQAIIDERAKAPPPEGKE